MLCIGYRREAAKRCRSGGVIRGMVSARLTEEQRLAPLLLALLVHRPKYDLDQSGRSTAEKTGAWGRHFETILGGENHA